jgi:mannose-6-phosphate isomerase-like protein (cupin superfamily)
VADVVTAAGWDLLSMKLFTQIEHETASQWFVDELASAAMDRTTGRAQTALIERGAPQGAMAPLHKRGEDETYRVLEGEVTWFIGDDVVPAGPGDVVVATSGVARTFHVESDDARWVVLTRVVSLERFVDFNRAVAKPPAVPVSGWPSAEEEASLASIAAANGIELLAPPGVLPDPSR